MGNTALNIKKCRFQQDELLYLEHKLSKDGIHADENKIRNIADMHMLKDRKFVQRLLNLISYMVKFIPDLPSITEPLGEMLQKEHTGMPCSGYPALHVANPN